MKLANEFNDYYIEKINTLREAILSIKVNKVIIATEKFVGDVLNSFQPTTEDELKEIINEFGIKASLEDPIPAKVLQSVIDVALV